MDLQQEIPTNFATNEGYSIMEEYVVIVESLKQELEQCKVEQSALRSEVEAIRNENKIIANAARDSFSKIVFDDCGGDSVAEKETISDLQKRVAVLQMDKDSVVQLWQMALKAIHILEAELKTLQGDGNSNRISEQQLNSIRETYSDAIKALEAKLVQAKENFLKQQKLWESSKEKINVLTTEKAELERQFVELQKNVKEKELLTWQEMEARKTELDEAKLELEKRSKIQSELESKLAETQVFLATVIAKDHETKNKVSEAIELVESAVREKELALQREAQTLEERLALENNMVKIVEDYKVALQTEVAKVKESYERNIKKYLLEMKELKVELQQKATLLDRSQRECRLVEEELDNVRHGSDNFLQQSNSKVLTLQQHLQDAELKLETIEDSCKKKYVLRIEQLEEHVRELEEKLLASTDNFKRMQKQGIKDMEERLQEADDRVKESVDRYAILERRLSRVIDEREHVTAELRSLQENFDRETKRKEQERRFLENRVRELQDDVRKRTSSMDQTAAHGILLTDQINILELELKKRSSSEKLGTDIEHRSKTELVDKMKELQEKCERKTNELTRHVETHQKLSKKWKDEAKRLTLTFQKRLRELRAKIISLRKENEELNKELLAARHQVAQFREKMIHRYDQGDTQR